MSSAQKLTKKQKKALAFRERKGKSKAKVEDEDEDNDVPVLEEQDTLEAEGAAGAVEDEAKPARHAATARAKDEGVLGSDQSTKPKKRKREEEGEAALDDGAKQKQKKKKRRVADGEDGAAVADGIKQEAGEQDGEGKGKTKQRFILFIGNLKYTTSKEAIDKHFSACDPPPTVRLLTQKATPNGRQATKSKGCAFLEFTVKSALQQALKLHQSELDGRMINVELTAGGGGKSETRIEKVKKRNKELHEQRRKRLEKETKKPKADVDAGSMHVPRPQRYSATSGVEQVPLKKRTWTIGEPDDEDAAKKSKKRGKRPPRALGTGVNAIPVG
ncbi:uncharacterized protein C8Q71DRAFT_857333 [Rhodofomes roseus]|uniref:RRM domain-containing protein n=1 Tax=Rhodofomes roseus TaxID=34475 RepID=A0ABQ8KGM0_9APHY|nr:uncharacterized protein C8Q71DRAFT_857333 [Rhodofomes roseus]KAH9837006.1 hypothetical protein C8Q71DRAFT_857333 [Rhodofomes roseus]